MNSLRKSTQLPVWVLASVTLVAVLSLTSTAFLIGKATSGRSQSTVVYLPSKTGSTNTGYVPGSSQIPVSGGYAPVTNQPNTMLLDAPSGGGNGCSIGFSGIDLSCLDPANWISNFFKAFRNALLGPQKLVNQEVSQIGSWLIQTPDFTQVRAAAPLRLFSNALRAGAVSLLILLVALSAYRIWFGLEPSPGALMGRILAAIFCLLFYQEIAHYLLWGSNTLAHAVFALDPGTVTGDGWSNLGFWGKLKSLGASEQASVLESIVAIISFVMLLVVGFIRVISLAGLVVLYAIGPMVIPLLAWGRGGHFALWFSRAGNALIWPIVWAVEARLFLTLGNNLGLTGFKGILFTPMLQIALLYVMYKTPSWVSQNMASTSTPAIRRAQNAIFTYRAASAVAGATGVGAIATVAATRFKSIASTASRGGNRPAPAPATNSTWQPEMGGTGSLYGD